MTAVTICLYCSKPIQTRESGLCPMHYGRLRRNGHPLLKRRARGVMDGPVLTYVSERRLGEKRRRNEKTFKPSQMAVAVVLAKANGDVVTRSALAARTGLTRTAIEQAVFNIRARYGRRVIETQYGAGYYIPAAVLTRVLGVTGRELGL